MRLQGKVAIITGGANGIGRATAELFAREGATVVIADRDQAAGEECAQSIRGAGGQAWFILTDVASDADVDRMVAESVARFGGLEVLVNGAAVDIIGSVVDTEPARWQRVLDVNLSSVYCTCRAAIPQMQRRGGGSIVNISSIQALYGYSHYAAYAAAKAGILGLTRQITADYSADSIRCNAISPGGVDTRMTENSARLEPEFALDPGAGATQLADLPAPEPESARPASSLFGLAKPVDIAYAALFLASEESAHVSGQNLIVDGGQTARG